MTTSRFLIGKSPFSTTVNRSSIAQSCRFRELLPNLLSPRQWRTVCVVPALNYRGFSSSGGTKGGNARGGEVPSGSGLTGTDGSEIIDKVKDVNEKSVMAALKAPLFVLGLLALAGSYGVAVQTIRTVGGIVGVALAFAGRDFLRDVLGGLSIQLSRFFSVGDTIEVGSVEGQVMKIELTTTSLLSAEMIPVMVPNSIFSSQSKEEFRSAQEDILLESAQIIKKHGGILGWSATGRR